MSAFEGLSQTSTPALTGIAEMQILAIDLGATKTALRPGETGEVSTARTLRTLEGAAADMAIRTAEAFGDVRFDAIGVAIAGEVSKDGSTIVSAGELQNWGWTGAPIQEAIADVFDVDPERVFLGNDVQYAGYGQRAADDKRGLLVPGYTGLVQTVSSGHNGSVYGVDAKGVPMLPNNGELGHRDSGKQAPGPCGAGHEHCIEAWIGGESVGRQWGERMENVPANDPRWGEYRQTFVEQQRRLLEILHEDEGVNPDRMSFFGSVVLKGHGVFGHLKEEMARSHPNVTVERVDDGDTVGLRGAFYAAREMLRSS